MSIMKSFIKSFIYVLALCLTYVSFWSQSSYASQAYDNIVANLPSNVTVNTWGNSIQAWEASWNLTAAELDGYREVAVRVYNATQSFLSTNGPISSQADLTNLRNTLSDVIWQGQNIRSGGQYRGTAYFRWSVLIVWCWNIDFWNFHNAWTPPPPPPPPCDPVDSAFECSDLSINGFNADSNWDVVLYVDDLQRPLTISWLTQTRVANRCPGNVKVGPNMVQLDVRTIDWVQATAKTNLASELRTTGTILNNNTFNITGITQTGNYELDFFPLNGNTNLGVAAGNCSLTVIESPTPEGACGVNENGAYNGTWNGILDPGETCDITPAGVRLGVFGNRAPGCSTTCQTLNNDPVCGNGVVDPGEVCDFNDPARPWEGSGQTCSQTCELVPVDNGNPQIRLEKYSNNSADLDSNTTLGTDDNDSQTIVSWSTAAFQIRVINAGDVSLDNVVITDQESPSCDRSASQSLLLIQAIWNRNDTLDPNESFIYNCEQPNTTLGFDNIAVVTADPTNGWNEVTANDDTRVIIEGPSINIQKYNGNVNDLDGSNPAQALTPLDDSQTVPEWSSAVFRITVENTGTRNLDRLRLIDPLAANCALDSVNLPAEQWNVPWTFLNRTGRVNLAELQDSILQPQEQFTYVCERWNVTPIFTTNTVTVEAFEVSTNTQVTANDSTAIVVLPDNPGVCTIDGTRTDPEICDPLDPTREWFGTRGCTNQCTPDNGGWWWGGGWAVCESIDVRASDVICTSRSFKTKSFRVRCDEDKPNEFVFESYNDGNNPNFQIVPRRWKFEATLRCSNGVNNPQCFVHKDDNLDSSTTLWWQTNNSCKASWGGWGGPVCPSNDPRCGVCEYNDAKQLVDQDGNVITNQAQKNNCPELQTIPWWVDYHNPTYADGQQNKLLCLKVTDRFGNDIKTSVFDLNGWLEVWNPIIKNVWDKPPVLLSGLLTDQVNNAWSEAVTINKAAIVDSHACILMSSVTPGSKQFEFDLYIPTRTREAEFVWDGNYRKIAGAVTSRPVEFRKPFVGRFEVADGTLTPKINTKQTYNTLLSRAWWVDPQYSDGLLALTSQSVQPINTPGQRFSSMEVIKRSLYDTNWIRRDYAPFKATIQATNDESVLLAPGIVSNKIPLKYNLNWKTVQYYLTRYDRWYDATEFTLNGNAQETLGLKIIWPLQWDGKASITGQNKNFSDISKGPQRWAIKQKAYQIIKGMQSGQTVNGVRYIKWENVTLSSTPDYETLVVEDGNVIISGDLLWDTLGIIVMSSSTSAWVDSDGVYNAGNIFVQPNVSEINAVIYGDGGLISANNSWKPYVKNSAPRTAALNRQLLIEWTIFTRNTIGGAVTGTSGSNKLPGWEVTANFDRAAIYDLNYMRTWVRDLVESAYPNATLIIRFTPSVQQNPPKWFK